jgi:XRE family transcriptional regulator, regulator of sulfur utilization
MFTRRDIVVALSAFVVTLGAVAAQTQTSVMRSSLFDWNNMTAKQTDVGAVRQFFRSPTATLDELELHVTTLNPGASSHPPHKHPNEELVIIKEGTVEALVNGELRKAGPGSVIFNASNELHSIKNIGTTPATYHVINWRSPAAQKAQP